MLPLHHVTISVATPGIEPEPFGGKPNDEEKSLQAPVLKKVRRLPQTPCSRCLDAQVTSQGYYPWGELHRPVDQTRVRL